MRILVELDALMDTRLGAMAGLRPEAAVKLVTNQAYYDRKSDNFEALTGVPDAAYRAAYQKRDATTLENSRMTHAVMMLREMTSHLVETAENTPLVGDVIVEINVYPYRVEDLDLLELRNAIAAHCAMGTEVVLQSHAPMALTPQLLKKEYSAYIVYNFDAWYSANSHILQEFDIPEVTIFAPALFLDKEPEWTTEDRAFLAGKDPFGLIEEGHATIVKLHFFSADTFSILQYWRIGAKTEDAVEASENPS